MVKQPAFEVRYNGTNREIFRDIPNAAFDVIFEVIFNHHKELLGLVALSAFGGLRPSEACNVRREDSPLSSGILLQKLTMKSLELMLTFYMSMYFEVI